MIIRELVEKAEEILNSPPYPDRDLEYNHTIALLLAVGLYSCNGDANFKIEADRGSREATVSAYDPFERYKYQEFARNESVGPLDEMQTQIAVLGGSIDDKLDPLYLRARVTVFQDLVEHIVLYSEHHLADHGKERLVRKY